MTAPTGYAVLTRAFGDDDWTRQRDTKTLAEAQAFACVMLNAQATGYLKVGDMPELRDMLAAQAYLLNEHLWPDAWSGCYTAEAERCEYRIIGTGP